MKLGEACPFCRGQLIYVESRRMIRQPELIQCLGECGFQMDNEDYKKPTKLLNIYYSWRTNEKNQTC